MSFTPAECPANDRRVSLGRRMVAVFAAVGVIGAGLSVGSASADPVIDVGSAASVERPQDPTIDIGEPTSVENRITIDIGEPTSVERTTEPTYPTIDIGEATSVERTTEPTIDIGEPTSVERTTEPADETIDIGAPTSVERTTEPVVAGVAEPITAAWSMALLPGPFGAISGLMTLSEAAAR